MGHLVLNQDPVPHSRGHSDDVQEAFILNILNAREEVVIIVRGLRRSWNCSNFFNVPLVQSMMVQIPLELGHDGRLKEGSYEQGESFALKMQQSKSTMFPRSMEYHLFRLLQLVCKQPRFYTR